MSFKFEEISEIGEFQKNARERIRARLVKANGRLRVDVRTFFLDTTTDEVKPSGRGLCLSLEQAISALDLLHEAVDSMAALSDAGGGDTAPGAAHDGHGDRDPE